MFKMKRDLCTPVQTKNSVNVRWNTIRNNSKKSQRIFSSIGNGEESALFKHYFQNHHDDIEIRRMDNAYKIMYLELLKLRP